MAFIEIDNVSYSYDDERNALGRVSFGIDAGEFVSVLGSNGSLTGYGGGLERKIALLKLEGIEVKT